MSTSAETCTFVLTFVVKPSEEIPGRWIGHCLELDVVSEGSSSAHAKEMVLEATGMIVKDDYQNGRDPFHRQPYRNCEPCKLQTLMQRFYRMWREHSRALWW